jgi:uncharacterized protein YdaU (DUF1376 family)
MAGVRYIKFYPGDWQGGTRGVLNLEERGLYIAALAYMWDSGEPLPGNDRLAAKLLDVQPLKYAKVMESLVAKGKMVRGQGSVFNPRALEDLDEYRAGQAGSSERVRKGWSTRIAKNTALAEAVATIATATQGATTPHTPPLTPPHTPPVRGVVTPPVTPPVANGKANGINGHHMNGHSIVIDKQNQKQKTEEEYMPSLAESPPVQPTPLDSKRGSRLPQNWTLPDEWREWAEINHSADRAVIAAEADRFRDHWISKPGQGGVKLDWFATWRNWCRNSRGVPATKLKRPPEPKQPAPEMAPWLRDALERVRRNGY